MPDVGRFFNIDKLAEKYLYQSPYNFSENKVVAHRELEGLEAVDFRKTDGYKNLVIVNFGYDGQNRKSGATQKIGPDDALVRIKGNSLTRVVNYASSQKDDTKKDILGSVNSFRKAHPNGNVILVGHSGGADNNVELAKENPKVKINLMITLDVRDPKQTGWTDANIPGNVDNAINYYQNTDKLNLVSDRTMDFSGDTNGTNILSPGSNHRSIDNDQVTNVIQDINNQIMNNNPVENASNRKQKVNNPALSNSAPVSQ